MYRSDSDIWMGQSAFDGSFFVSSPSVSSGLKATHAAPNAVPHPGSHHRKPVSDHVSMKSTHILCRGLSPHIQRVCAPSFQFHCTFDMGRTISLSRTFCAVLAYCWFACLNQVSLHPVIRREGGVETWTSFRAPQTCQFVRHFVTLVALSPISGTSQRCGFSLR